MDNEDYIAALDRIKQTQNQLHNDLKDLIVARHALTIAEIGALEDKMKLRFEKVYLKQDITNGSIRKHDARIKRLEDKDIFHYDNCPNTASMGKMDKKIDDVKDNVGNVRAEIIGPFVRKHWKSIVFASVISYFIMYVLFESFKLIDIIKIIR